MTKAGQEGGLSERLTAAARSWLAARRTVRPSAPAQLSAETWRRQRSSRRAGGGAWTAGAGP